MPYPKDHPRMPYPIILVHSATQNHPPAAPVASPVLAFIILGPEELFLSIIIFFCPVVVVSIFIFIGVWIR
ncbi:uncharacterized protein STEHIDRAFT_154363 [Stereum hirsutum FP-91666 SS1]|uniref:uncharacterized protein n=1 Tax=Stereum hirsutum (strain FP-91666) TaxID=721885 RepID=UPI000440A447|nr:uncharacterized protein STEHIDRAFT_154363 [Stereum hirsutum FP-91666 SS1]EIM90546.1 hypothetical protein STEHIDRAFT_154363 [Stereum hirsutum FP-91666 SS1]